jgi:chromosome segregation ATPase
MVEPLLYAALGFLVASLLALFFGRALWNRAVRLTTHRVMRRLPLSRDEIVAARDLLRAEHAVEHRRLERQSNLMRERMGASMAAVGQRDARIAELRASIDADREKLATSAQRQAEAQAEIDRLVQEHDALRGRLAETERHLAVVRRDLEQSQNDRRELLELADSRREELAHANLRLADLRGSGPGRGDVSATADAIDLQAQLNAARTARLQEAERADRLEARLTAAEAQLAQALTRLEAGGAGRADAATALPADAEDLALLRQQIEALAREIAHTISDKGSASARAARTPAEAS